jgi:hypothetical protein
MLKNATLKTLGTQLDFALIVISLITVGAVVKPFAPEGSRSSILLTPVWT